MEKGNTKVQKFSGAENFPKTTGLRATFSGQKIPTMNPADPIRLRLRQLLHEGGVSQTDLCKRLEKATGETWRIPRLSKLLNGHIALRVEDVVLMAQAAGISLVELFREPGREFVADLTPSELRLLAAARDNRKTLDTLLAVTDLAPKQKVKPNRRLARERTKLRLRENT